MRLGWVILLLLLTYTMEASSLKEIYKQSKATSYSSFSSADFDKATKLFGLLFRGEKNSSKLSPYLVDLGLKRELVDKVWVISDTQNRGWGLYMIRDTRMEGALISVPHRFFDAGTGVIGRKFFESFSHYYAIAFNTIHRKVMDMAHRDNTLFNAFHFAFAEYYPENRIYQLHGFDPSKRQNKKAQQTDIIMSNTTTQISDKMQQTTSCLNHYGYQTLLFGRDTDELGGTTNVQGKMCKSMGFRGFFHIEMSRKFRKLLKSKETSIEEVGQCVQ